MKFSFTEEQDEFRSVLRRFFEDKSPSTEVRRLMATSEGWERPLTCDMIMIVIVTVIVI